MCLCVCVCVCVPVCVCVRMCVKVELAVNVEELLPRRIRRWLMIGSRKVRLNPKLGVLERARTAFSGTERFDSSENIARALKPPLVSSITQLP